MDSQKYSLTQNCFVAQLDNVKYFHSVLKAINYKDTATFRPSEDGLKITVEDSKCVQCSAYIPSQSFTRYKLNDGDEVTFVTNLSVITECLNMFSTGDFCSIKMYYRGPGFPFTLVLEENNEENLLIDCSIKTQEPEELLDFSISDSTLLNFVIIQGSALVSILSDADRHADIMELLLSPDTPYMRITTIGAQGESQVDIPSTSDMIDTFRCTTVATSRYRFSHIRLMSKAMLLASKVCLRTDDCGLLSAQIMVNSETKMFIEFFITPLIDDDE